jgi:hypothetical protein
MKNANTRDYCVAAVCTTNSNCTSPQVCSVGFCLPKCTDSAECPIILDLFGSANTVEVDGRPHAVCNTTSGVCEF